MNYCTFWHVVFKEILYIVLTKQGEHAHMYSTERVLFSPVANILRETSEVCLLTLSSYKWFHQLKGRKEH